MVKTKRKTPNNAVKRQDPDGNLIYRIDRRRKKGRYVVAASSNQAELVPEIELRGFQDLPSGLYKGGFGFTSGYYLPRQLADKFGAHLKICIDSVSPSNIRRYGKTARVTLNHNDLSAIHEAVRQIKSERKQDIERAIGQFLGAVYPAEFDKTDEKFSSYKPGRLANVLKAPDIANNLSEKDNQALQDFYPDFVRGLHFTLRSARNLRFISEGMNATRTIYLQKVVAEFENKLQTNSHEHAWQKFLRKHILLLLHSYAAVVEKQSVDIDGKYPDFMLVDPYGYLDIYEIKKPHTRVLKHDRGRDNYYWDVEICKAISQVENYIDHTARHHLELAQKISRKSAHDVKIVRPRGFIIAGCRAQLGSEQMAEDFRILNDSLKSIDVIFYDDLLGNVKALIERFAAPAAQNSSPEVRPGAEI